MLRVRLVDETDTKVRQGRKDEEKRERKERERKERERKKKKKKKKEEKEEHRDGGVRRELVGVREWRTPRRRG